MTTSYELIMKSYEYILKSYDGILKSYELLFHGGWTSIGVGHSLVEKPKKRKKEKPETK